MAQEFFDRLDKGELELGRELGDIDPVESWWVERQEALERAGYMLRPRYRPGWKPSWADTNEEYIDCEDGQQKRVSMPMHSRFLFFNYCMNLVAFGQGCHPDLRRKTRDAKETSQGGGSVRASDKPAILYGATLLEPPKSLRTPS